MALAKQRQKTKGTAGKKFKHPVAGTSTEVPRFLAIFLASGLGADYPKRISQGIQTRARKPEE